MFFFLNERSFFLNESFVVFFFLMSVLLVVTLNKYR